MNMCLPRPSPRLLSTPKRQQRLDQQAQNRGSGALLSHTYVFADLHVLLYKSKLKAVWTGPELPVGPVPTALRGLRASRVIREHLLTWQFWRDSFLLAQKAESLTHILSRSQAKPRLLHPSSDNMARLCPVSHSAGSAWRSGATSSLYMSRGPLSVDTIIQQTGLESRL